MVDEASLTEKLPRIVDENQRVAGVLSPRGNRWETRVVALLALCACSPTYASTPPTDPASAPALTTPAQDLRRKQVTAAMQRCNSGEDEGCASAMTDDALYAEARQRVMTDADGFGPVLKLLERACAGGNARSCETVRERQQKVDAFLNANWISESEAAGVKYDWTIEQAQEHLGQACTPWVSYDRKLEGKVSHEEAFVCSNPDGSGVELLVKDGKIASITVRGRLPP